MSGAPPRVQPPPEDTSSVGAGAVASSAGYPSLAPRIAEVEKSLESAVLAMPQLLRDAAGHLIAAGGKRVRPALTILCADMIDEKCPDAVTAAVAVELVHLGSLHHDDVIDGADTRRGVPSVNASWSNTVAVLSGDFLLARASQLAASLGARAASLLADTIAALASGEMLELEHTGDLDTSIETYLEAIAGKTASLMSTACHLGAYVASDGHPNEAIVAEFGLELGLVFQIVDDVLDLIADDRATGKTCGIDLYEGVYTLPTLCALRSEREDELRELLVPDPTPDQVGAAIRIIGESGGIEAAVDVAAKHLARCDTLLDELPQTDAAVALGRLSRYVLDRTVVGL